MGCKGWTVALLLAALLAVALLVVRAAFRSETFSPNESRRRLTFSFQTETERISWRDMPVSATGIVDSRVFWDFIDGTSHEVSQMVDKSGLDSMGGVILGPNDQIVNIYYKDVKWPSSKFPKMEGRITQAAFSLPILKVWTSDGKSFTPTPFQKGPTNNIYGPEVTDRRIVRFMFDVGQGSRYEAEEDENRSYAVPPNPAMQPKPPVQPTPSPSSPYLGNVGGAPSPTYRPTSRRRR